jgi:hypothetical protein
MRRMTLLLAIGCSGLALGCQDSQDLEAAKAKMRQTGENMEQGAEKLGESARRAAAEGEVKAKGAAAEAAAAGKSGLHRAAGAVKDEAARLEDATE